MPTHLKAAALAIVAVVGLVTLLAVNTLVAGRLQPRAGDPWALPTAGPGSEAGQPQHLIVYTPTCRWCRLQLQELRALGVDSAGSPIVLLAIGNEADTRAQVRDLSLRARILPIARAELEAVIGEIRTPTHIVVGSDGAVAAFHQGYLAGPELLRLRSAASPPGSPRSVDPSREDGGTAPTTACSEDLVSAGTCQDTPTRSAP